MKITRNSMAIEILALGLLAGTNALGSIAMPVRPRSRATVRQGPVGDRIELHPLDEPVPVTRNVAIIQPEVKVPRVRDPVTWILDDVAALVEGLAGQVEGLAQLDHNALLPRYGRYGGRNWPGPQEMDHQPPLTTLDHVFRDHDYLYRVPVEEGAMTLTEADRQLLKDMWLLSIKRQPCLAGQVYRVLATAAFGLKQGLWNRGR